MPALQLSAAAHDRILILFLGGSVAMAQAELRSMGLSDTEAEAWLLHRDSCVRSWTSSPDDRDVLCTIDQAFGGTPRPEHFTNFTHCDECAEHDATLLARPRERLRRSDLGSSGWDPLTFTCSQGMAHLMPTLARFVLGPAGGRYGWYGEQLAWHLSQDGLANRLYAAFSLDQRAAILALVTYVIDSRDMQIASSGSGSEFQQALLVWSREN